MKKWWKRLMRTLEALERLDRMRMRKLTPDQQAWIAHQRWMAMNGMMF